MAHFQDFKYTCIKVIFTLNVLTVPIWLYVVPLYFEERPTELVQI